MLLKRRSLVKTYIVWLFLGILGGHYFYCYQYEAGFLYLFTLGGFIFGWIGDVFIIPMLVFQTNQQVDVHNREEMRRFQRFGAETILDGGKSIYPIIEQVMPTNDDGEVAE